MPPARTRIRMQHMIPACDRGRIAGVGTRLGPVTTLRPSNSAPPNTAGATARYLTEPLRELVAIALLIANGVLQFVGVSALFFVLDNWGGGFGARSAAVFGRFTGPIALGLPMVALLLATHVAPMVRRSRA